MFMIIKTKGIKLVIHNNGPPSHSINWDESINRRKVLLPYSHNKMKTTTLVGVLSLCFLFSAIIAKPLFAITGKDDEGEPVLDIKGEEVRTDSSYYMVSIIWGPGGGGVSMANVSGCPLDVIQLSSDRDYGKPVRLTPLIETTGDVVRQSTNLNIKFSTSTPCNDSTVWRVNQYDDSTKQYFISTGGVEGNLWPETIFSRFKIIKINFFNKLVYCPWMCAVCKDIGYEFLVQPPSSFNELHSAVACLNYY
ncbi:unnamed protein product [Thlaspi arvense]|uniref:Uncharacterized protein n=1 Tax=Thlaspi arvense TaxID=13288 RepID=A0AAU9S097_THLAR|nr:unnamed protein product [Thlaspi arvense]